MQTLAYKASGLSDTSQWLLFAIMLKNCLGILILEIKINKYTDIGIKQHITKEHTYQMCHSMLKIYISKFSTDIIFTSGFDAIKF